MVIGKPQLRDDAPLRPGGGVFSRPDAFAQANLWLLPRLVQAGVEAAGLKNTDRVLELYAGSGAFTFALAARCKEIVAVESDPVAVELAKRGNREGPVPNVRLAQGDAVKTGRALVQDAERFDVLLADPPRTGARGIGSLARDAAVRTVVYVSCDAAHLARDANELKRSGFLPATLQLVDMFPQTRHVEAVMAFHRKG
jgi:23S rRNA (uracil1939-C5)-methyltransferase